MYEPLEENLSILNQLCKKALEKVKEYPSPNQLYCLQLALWGLESGQVEQVDDRPLKEHLEYLMYHWKDKDNVMKFLLGNESSLLSWARNREDREPVALAGLILEQLNSRLTEEVEGYPR